MTSKSHFQWRRTLTVASLSLLGICASGISHAQSWPSKPIRIVVGFAPGGTTDAMARLVAQSLTDSLGQSVVIDNKPGASGNIAAAEVARATPDGYTLFISPTSVETVNPHLIKSNLLPSRDLTPVAGLTPGSGAGGGDLYLRRAERVRRKGAGPTVGRAAPHALVLAPTASPKAPQACEGRWRSQLPGGGWK